VETNKDFLEGDAWESDFEANKDDARDAFIDEARKLIQPIEHHVDEIDLTVHVDHVPEVADAIVRVSNLRYFDFKVELEGKYQQVYEETFSYDFTLECVDFLRDELGYSSSQLLTKWENGL
jgi:hypothetical protein